MRDGRVEQEGAPEALYAQPRSIFTAEFIGAPPMNILDPAACGLPAGGVAHAPLPAAPADCRVGIRPEAIRLAAAGLPARLLGADYLGADSIVIARAGEPSIVVRVPGRRHVTDGERTHLSWSADAVHLFDRDSGTRIDL
jgi:sn-glycerol 3-phosphate transport system ATP-binding protein